MESTIKWISVDDDLPKISPEDMAYSIGKKVLTAWDYYNMAEMYYVHRNIRGKIVSRFEWQNKISPFTVKWWAYFPEHPMKIMQKPPCDHYYAEALGVGICIHCKKERE